MKNMTVKLGVMLLGYVTLSDLASLWLALPVAKSLAAYVMLIGIYCFPPRLKVDFINWAGGSALVVISVFLIDSSVLNLISILLVSAYFLSRIK